MAKYKIEYWQGGNIESTVINAPSKESATYTFYFFTNFTDIISIDEVIDLNNEELIAECSKLREENAVLKEDAAELAEIERMIDESGVLVE